VEADHPLAFLGYGGFIYQFFFVFSFVLAGLLISRCLLWGSGRAKVSSIGFFGRFFTVFLLILEARSTRLHRFLIDTRPPIAFPGVFRPCRRKHRSYRSLVIGAWCTRAWELSAPWCACGHAPPFFGPCSMASGSLASDLRLGGSSDGACRTRATIRRFSASSPTAGSLFLGFLLFVFVFFMLFVSGLSLLVFGSNFMIIFVSKLLDQPFLFRE
jgi:hypothetical protein